MAFPTRRSICLLVLLATGCSEEAPPAVPVPESATKGLTITREQVVRESVEDAQRLLAADKPADAATVLEETLQVEPTHRKALFLYAHSLSRLAADPSSPHRGAASYRAAAALRLLRTTYPELSADEKGLLPLVLYQEAQAFALDGKTTNALDSLKEAADVGFASLPTIQADESMKALRGSDAFKAAYAQVEARALANAKQAATSMLATYKSFPFDFKLPSVTGSTVELKEFAGNVVLVDFWGTWCPPCLRGIPHLMALEKTLGDRGFRVVGLAFEQALPDVAKERVRDAVKTFEISYPCLIADEAVRVQVPEFRGFPTMLVVDRAGKVRAQFTGIDPEDSLVLDAVLDALLAEPRK